jgi:hypothetical protein
MTERDPIHDLLEAAAKHRQHEYTWEVAGVELPFVGDDCVECGQDWPCLVTKLAAELHHLRKQTICVCD